MEKKIIEITKVLLEKYMYCGNHGQRLGNEFYKEVVEVLELIKEWENKKTV